MNTKYFFLLFLILLSGCLPADKPHGSTSKQATTGNAINSSDGIELKKVSDIEPRFKAVKDASIEDLAQTIAEVDEWLFAAEDEKLARESIEKEIELLRARIETEVTSLSKAALDAPSGKLAAEAMSKISSNLKYYPVPKTDVQRAKLEQIASGISSTSSRVEDIRRLRYNKWAISLIQIGLNGYRNEMKVRGFYDASKVFKTNKESLISICIISMSTINPAFLEPAVMDLYNHVYGLTKESIGDNDEYLVKLAQGFANPSTTRKTPSDF